MFSILCSLAMTPGLSWLFAVPATAQASGVNKATFDRIERGMTAHEIQTLVGRGKTENDWVTPLGYAELQLYCSDDDSRRIWVEYEPNIATGRTTRAEFQDFSTTPFATFELRRLATKKERAGAIQQLAADAERKAPLGHSVLIAKQIPVDSQKAIAFIKDRPDYQSYHVLLALRNSDPETYQTIPARVRASVLCSTLKEQSFFDDWTPPDCEYIQTESDKALIECGTCAIAGLMPLLGDRTTASNSEYEEEPEYQYRRADYAIRYISWILHLPFEFQEEFADRDRDIAVLQRKLGH